MSAIYKWVCLVLAILVAWIVCYSFYKKDAVDKSPSTAASRFAEQDSQRHASAKNLGGLDDGRAKGSAISLPYHASVMLRSAREGNKGQACKIAELLTKCRNLKEAGDSDTSSRKGFVAFGASSISSRSTLECDGISDLPPNEIISYWRKAAEMGDSPSVRFYVTGRPFRLNDTIASLDELSAFKQSAERIALKAAANGDAIVALSLADAYYPWGGAKARQSLLGQTVEKSAARSLAIYERVIAAMPAEVDVRTSNLHERLNTLRLRSSSIEIAEAARLFAEWKPLVYVSPVESANAAKICDAF
ncbi:hypothetical protein JWH11_09760 [Xanthomonas melonis]|uniref:Uncharacterized protein n=1 Tax=Xanthomonas melonis TaxID=56456 RepID=A0ABS8NUV6_9XANT|nr:hypothetical protein [Xanthomonas melonis]MCD0256795.1 hypothetical protein [Xanthomonas melonis]MCD0266712.1 hypothetical protein [Xanthomonas melonis]